MKYFEEAIKAAKRVQTNQIKTNEADKLRESVRRFAELASECRIFLFNSTTPTREEYVPVAKCGLELDLPFRTCWFENRTPHFFKYDASIPGYTTYGMLIHEISPNVYEAFSLFSTETYQEVLLAPIDLSDERYNFQWDVKIYLDLLRTGKFGSEKVNRTIKIGTKSNKSTLRIRDIVHVAPKNLVTLVPSACGNKIDWSHRFEVRGHWRKVEHIGKDRSGSYCVDGFTWVNDCVKGPESKPLIKKSRLVLPGSINLKNPSLRGVA